MVEEHGVHGLAYVVVAAEGERQVADASADVGPGQVLAYPAGGANEVQGVAVVLVDARCHGQHVGVEDDVAGAEAHFLGEYAIRAAGYLRTSLEGGGLSLLVEAHDDDGGSHALHVAGMADERLLAFFERDTIDDALALHALQSGHNDAPLAGVDHHGHTGNVGFRGDEVQEVGHLVLGIEQRVVHVDVDDECSVAHLLAGDADGLVVVALLDEPQKLS